jgi:uncharacterized protein (DUF488 family)
MNGDSVQKVSDLSLWTIGHSTRSLDEFLELLSSNQIRLLVDVRSYPGSKRFPQFNRDRLSTELTARQICYQHLARLGGRRKGLRDSKNTAWQNSSFRAYADHMESAEFKQGINELLELAREERTAIMCAEALWWKCHRGLIADYLKVIGVEVFHIINEKHVELHPYTTAAQIIEGELSYRGLLSM